LTANAAAGIEPALFGSEVTHSLATGVVIAISGEKQHGSLAAGQRPTAGGFPLPPFRWQEVSRACATGDVVHAREKSYAVYAESNRTLYRVAEKYPHTAPLAHACNARERSLFAEWIVLQAKYPRATPLAIAGKT